MEVSIGEVWFDQQKIFVKFRSGSIINAPLSIFKRLKNATQQQLSGYELWNDGQWIHWEELDEDLSAEGFLKLQEERNVSP